MRSFLEKYIMPGNQASNSILLDEQDIKFLIRQLESIKREFLYKSNFHGLYHSEKVMLFSYLIGKHQRLNDVEMQILMDAAVYHDIGRVNDYEENCHGFAASMKIYNFQDELLDNAIYADINNVVYLRAICDGHSKEDSTNKKIFDYYHYDNPTIEYKQFKKLYDILKDADALDRMRFKYSNMGALREKFLRLNYSKRLIDFSRYVNDYYRNRDIERLYNKYSVEYGQNGDINNMYACLHGIGADFFKLESILNNGILSSYARRKENIDVSRNFHGSNGELWISVVDADMVSENGKGLNRYIKEGISFFCFVPKLRKVNGNNNVDIQNKNEYDDEKYVFDRIRVEQIHSIIIPNKMKNQGIDELNYLICGTNYDTILNTIRYYKHQMLNRGFTGINDDKVIELLNSLGLEIIKYENLSHYEQMTHIDDFFHVLDNIKESINSEIQKWFKEFYNYILQNNNPNYTYTVWDIITNIMRNYPISNVLNSNDLNETVILLQNFDLNKNDTKRR